MFEKQERDDLMRLVDESDQVVRIERLTHHIARIREGMDELKMTMKTLAEAVSKIAVIEERQSHASNAIERLHSIVEKLDERLKKLEVAEPMQAKTSEWVMNAVWAGAAAVAMFIAAKAGLL